ncbi:hypothetical protein B0H63DRAFT_461058 [Podospora didyma]|uniref:Small ribosomal subunit protein uS11m n=1 Tax=Podospora didyma TaxID=330526 RepID=A0AAE0P701_9PEZI|nr:hypothetical protein B0H63DRAFT_461058 [Podospora didyma]
MSRFSMSRLLARGLAQTTSRPQCPTLSAPLWSRAFSQSAPRRNDRPQTPNSNSELLARTALQDSIGINPFGEADLFRSELSPLPDVAEPYHFHIYSHKHNTHITVTNPNRDALISLSCGNIGFKKSQRKHYDSAYQLGAYVVDKMHQMGIVKDIHKLEIVLRGFGNGREAVTKVLLGTQGLSLRDKIVRVSDATRLKFGGTRSKAKRRLG